VTYGVFLALFLGIPLLVGSVLLRRQIDKGLVGVLTVLSLIALAYTAPWDNLIVVAGVWSYAPRQILGVVIGHVPLEEYVFYVLQVFLTGLVTVALLRRERH
jgi:lycopene cyclase domain-containing protein